MLMWMGLIVPGFLVARRSGDVVRQIRADFAREARDE